MTDLRATSAFIEKLLAPIASSEEQADTPQHRRALWRDATDALRAAVQRWALAMENVRVASAAQTVAGAAFRESGERYATDSTPFAIRFDQASQRRIAAEEAQCLIPAPTAKELRWKKRVLKWKTRVPENVLAVIAADEARLTARGQA